MFKNKIIKLIALVAILAVVFNAGSLYGSKQLPFVGSPQIVNEDLGKPADLDFSLFWDTWRTVEEKYAGKTDKTKMFYGAISGMVSSLGDPYTVFMDPEETKKFGDELEGTFNGIGVEIGIKKNIITVIAPISDSPAEKAGLKTGDKILKIGDTTTNGMSTDEAANLIRGPKGTPVTLIILRGNETETREIKVTRDTIVVKSVKLKMDDSSGKKIAILEISRFEKTTFNDAGIAADEILREDAKGIILDLRNNPGGYFDSAVNIAGLFVPNGEVVTIKRYNNHNENYNASGTNKLGKIPMIILANEGTASAAEILAGALRDDRQIKILGETTFGKGLVQEVVDNTKDNSSLKITVAEWLTPTEKNINKEGLKPDIEIKLTKEDYEADKDPQMDEALKIMREQ